MRKEISNLGDQSVLQVRTFPPCPNFRWVCTVGVCAYLTTIAIPFQSSWDIPLILIALISVFATMSEFPFSSSRGLSISLDVPVLIFLVATVLSIWGSEDVYRSLRLSSFLLPATLLYFLIAEHFQSTRSIGHLYLTLSLIGIGLSLTLLWSAWRTGEHSANVWVSNVGSPLLIVPNDVTILAVIAPLSLTLLVGEENIVTKTLALISLFLSACVVAIFQSRTATLTLIATIAFVATLLRRRIAVLCLLIVLAVILLTDGFLGFHLLAKFGRNVIQDRLALWEAAWGMFGSAPIFGHGPHTFVLSYQSYLPTTHPLGPDLIIPWAHNLYLDLLAEQGLIGLMALGFLLLRGLGEAWSTQRVTEREAQLFGAGALSGLGAICFAGLLEISFLRLWVTILLFVLLGAIAHLSAAHMPSK